VVKQLGDGTYGTVWKAINRQSNEVVVGAMFQCAWHAPKNLQAWGVHLPQSQLSC
jgi:hypothetical protein